MAQSKTDRIDRFLLHPLLGPAALVVVVLLMFQLVFTVADPFMGWIEAAPQIISAVARRGYVVSGGGCAPLTEQIVARILESGDADAHLDAMRRRCRWRRWTWIRVWIRIR